MPLQYMLTEPCHIKTAFLAKRAVLLSVHVAKMALVLFSGYVFSAIYAFDVVMRSYVLRHLFGWSAEVAIRALCPTMAGDQMCFPVSRWAELHNVYRIDMCPVRPTEIAALAFMVKLVSFAWCSIVRCCNPLDTTSLLEGRGVIDLRGRYGVSERLRLGRPAGRGSVQGLKKSWGAGKVAGCGGGNLW